MSEGIDYAARVQRGAALLDKKWPTWAQDIDLDTLDIADGTRCMTAQYAQKHDLGTYWWQATEPLGLENDYEDYEGHGFNTDGGTTEGGGYATLNALWRNQIQERRAQAQPEAGGQ